MPFEAVEYEPGMPESPLDQDDGLSEAVANGMPGVAQEGDGQQDPADDPDDGQQDDDPRRAEVEELRQERSEMRQSMQQLMEANQRLVSQIAEIASRPATVPKLELVPPPPAPRQYTAEEVAAMWQNDPDGASRRAILPHVAAITQGVESRLSQHIQYLNQAVQEMQQRFSGFYESSANERSEHVFTTSAQSTAKELAAQLGPGGELDYLPQNVKGAIWEDAKKALSNPDVFRRFVDFQSDPNMPGKGRIAAANLSDLVNSVIGRHLPTISKHAMEFGRRPQPPQTLPNTNGLGFQNAMPNFLKKEIEREGFYKNLFDDIEKQYNIPMPVSRPAQSNLDK